MEWIEQSLHEFTRCSGYVRLTGQPGARLRAPDGSLLEILDLHDSRELLVLTLSRKLGGLLDGLVDLQAAQQADFRLNFGWPLQFRSHGEALSISTSTPRRSLTHASLAHLVHLLQQAHARVPE